MFIEIIENLITNPLEISCLQIKGVNYTYIYIYIHYKYIDIFFK